jgi:putative hydrolase of the HAD superfamily
MKKPEYIILDLGGVIYSINYQNTIDNLSKLFDADLQAFFSKKAQIPVVDQFEEGQVSGSEFCQYLKESFNKPEIPDLEIRKAWDSILIGFKQETVEFLKELSAHIPLYLYSNTNEYHYSTLSEMAGEEFMDDFHNIFQEVFLSHTFQKRKPHPESFLALCSTINRKPEDGLFIDDSIQHIHGAQKAGLNTIHFQAETDLLENLLKDLIP